jgi:hypothetical protein
MIDLSGVDNIRDDAHRHSAEEGEGMQTPARGIGSTNGF